MFRPAAAVGISFVIGLASLAVDLSWVQYLLLFVILAVPLPLLEPKGRLFFLLVGVYVALGVLPFSNYRGTLATATISEYVLMSCAVLCSIGIADFMFDRGGRSNIEYSALSWGTKHVYVFAFICTISWLFLVKVYGQHGILLFNQFGRFDVGSYDAYLVKAASYLPLYFVASRRFRYKLRDFLLYILMPLLPTLLIGSRGGVLMVLLGVCCVVYVRISVHGRPGDASRLRRVLVGLIPLGYAVVALGFFLRRGSDGVYMTPSELHAAYFNTPILVSYLVMPIHLGLRETVGLTNFILERGVVNDVVTYPLFVADFYTLQAGEQISAGRALASVVGSVADGGLTPGLLGALRLDFGLSLSLIVVMLLSFSVAATARLAESRGLWTMLWALTLIQFVQLFHRGFAKPEYLMAYMVVLIAWLVPRLVLKV
ncbi:hypothetical protein MNR01_01085 [Lysobacter sp. S4-A87]|uniref:hypothetical protein n=1 Tax=Lysobacter sp. S4-A87 TaxID=2925843 RepID=UPI001F52DD28|nr:hypothetical protein [Lysobacter sp. S4-A87]UNK49666.1 hypothetical protein MNR01_01085 [Lysobacter sp. S4-A87]